MNWNKFLPCILFTTVLGACSGKGEQTNVEPAALCLNCICRYGSRSRGD